MASTKVLSGGLGGLTTTGTLNSGNITATYTGTYDDSIELTESLKEISKTLETLNQAVGLLSTMQREISDRLERFEDRLEDIEDILKNDKHKH